jgi:P2-related tail formation protein
MTTMQTDRLVDDYLSRLEEAAAHLQRSRRAELIAEIREHIEAALREEEAAGEVAVRNVLERLGPPEEIVEAAEPAPEAEQQRPTGKLEVAAMVTLVVPFIGWLFGIAMVLISKAWSNREKTIGTALALLAVVPFLTLAIVDSYSESSSSTFETLLFVLWVIGGLPSALYLGLRLRRDG